MTGFVKSLLIGILAAAAIIVLMNMAFFLPWYINVIEATFEVSQAVAADNCLSYENYHNIYDELKSKPIFRERAAGNELGITVVSQSGKDCIERSGGYELSDYYDSSYKPYVQRGESISVTVYASYPFRMTFNGEDVSLADIPVEFTIKTTALKHYKDLPYSGY